MNNETTITKGYKVTDPGMTCQPDSDNAPFKFEIGVEHVQPGTLIMCNNGFHFCEKISSCFSYYTFDSQNLVFEVEAYGEVITEGNKSCTSRIKLIRQIEWYEVLLLANEGKDNTGHSNTGYSNTGDWNTGDWNTGDWNTGYSNTGDRNAGAFCTGDAPFLLFNKPCSWTEKEFLNSNAFHLMRNNVDTKLWVPDHKMTDEEKAANKGWKTAEGYYKDIPFKEAFTNAWHNWSEKHRAAFTALPNFDRDTFLSITGVDVNKKS